MNDFERQTLQMLRTRASLFVAVLDELLELPTEAAKPKVALSPEQQKCPPHPRSALTPSGTFAEPRRMTCQACDATLDLDDPTVQLRDP